VIINRYLHRYLEKKRELEEAEEGLRSLLRSYRAPSILQPQP
jgi:hypothetical protein